MADEFNTALEAHVTSLATTWVGPGTHGTNFVKTFNDHLEPFDEDASPMLVVWCKQWEKAKDGMDIGPVPTGKTWQIDIYYLSVGKVWTTLKKQRDYIVQKLTNQLEVNPLLSGFQHVDDMGFTTGVVGSSVEGSSFDGSGEDGYYTFVTEMHLLIDTSTSN